MTLHEWEMDLDYAENEGRIDDPVWVKAFFLAVLVALVTFLRCEDGRQPRNEDEERDRQTEGRSR